MKISHDPRHNIAYIRFQERAAQVLTLKISDELNVDVGADGSVHGIELLNANEQPYKEDQGKLFLVNEATGKEEEISLTG
jgi:uncharacterized protein YuzE